MDWSEYGRRKIKQLPYYALCFATPLLVQGSDDLELRLRMIANFQGSSHLYSSIARASWVMRFRKSHEIWTSPDAVHKVLSALEEVRRKFDADLQTLPVKVV